MTTPMPEMNTLKQATTPASKLYNWNVIAQALELVNIPLDPDTKSLIIAGDREMVVEVLTQICEEETGKKIRNSEKQGYKTVAAEGGVMLENINENKPLSDANSCLEFLILSFCRNFSLRPKQGAGLLAQGCKFLAHIVAKGLKGDFDPVKIWLQEVYANSAKLVKLITAEINTDSLSFVMGTLKPGILSKNIEVVQWSFRVISRLVLDFNESGFLPQVWNWFLTENVLELCVAALQRSGKEIFGIVLESLLQLSQNNYRELFTIHFPNAVNDSKYHLEIAAEFLTHITPSDSSYEEIANAGVCEYWANLALNLIDIGNPIDSRVDALNFLVRILELFFSHIGDNDYLMNSIVGLVNRTCRDESVYLKTVSASYMFFLLEFLTEKKSNFAPVVYRTLTFLLMENNKKTLMREFLEKNFAGVFQSNSDIPIGILLDPFIKSLQISEVTLEVCDFDFLASLAQHPRLNLKHAIQLIDIVGKLYLNDLFYAKAAGVTYTFLASRYVESEPMQEYLYMFSKYSLNIVLAFEQNKTKPKGKNFEEKKQQRNRILNMVSWIIQQWQDGLNEKIKEILLQSNYLYSQICKKNSQSFLVVLDLFGSAQDLLEQFKMQNPKLFENQEIAEEPEKVVKVKKDPRANSRQLVLANSKNPSKASLVKKKPYFPWERAAGDIEKAKKQKQEKDQKILEEEKRQEQKLLLKKQQVKRQLEFRKLEQGVGKSAASLLYHEGEAQRLVAQIEEIELREFAESELDLKNAIVLMLNKYSRVFKILFTKYSGTGFALKSHHKSDFDLHADRKSKITDAEYIKIMNDHKVIPDLMTKEELRGIMRTYNHKIAKQAEQNYVDYEGFKGVFCQLAYFIYSRKPHDYSHLPPVVSLKFLLDFMRNSLKNNNISTEMFDEPDPGTGDKDVVKSLNKLLAKDPNTPMPDGYKKIIDKDLKIYFGLPACLGFSEAYSNAVEMLDTVLGKMGIRILEPQVEYITVYRAKGFTQKNAKRIAETPEIAEVKEKSKSAISMISTNQVKLSPALKFCIAHAPKEEKGIYEECADFLEDLLHSVQLKMVRIINRAPKIGAQEEKFEEKKEKERKDEEAKRAEEDKKRKIRQAVLQEELNKAKEIRAAKLQQDEIRREREKVLEEAKRKENEEKKRIKKEEKIKIIQEWAQKREEEKKPKEDEEENKKKQAEELKKFEEAKKRNQERLELALKEKAEKIKQIKTAEEKKAKNEEKEKEKKKESGLKQLKESKLKEESVKKKENINLVSKPEIKSLLATYSSQIDCVFTFYLTQITKDLPVQVAMVWEKYEKLSTQLGITHLIAQDQNLEIFNSFAKKKQIQALTFEEFCNCLVKVSWKAKTLLGFDEPGSAFEEFLKRIGVTSTVKALKKRLNGFEPKKVKKIEERKGEIEKRKEEIEKKVTVEKDFSFESQKSLESPGNGLKIGDLSLRLDVLDADMDQDSNSRMSDLFGD